MMELQEILYTQGFGPRRVCLGLVQHGLVTVAGDVVTDPHADFEPEGLRFTVEGKDWTYHAKAYLMLHKPAGYECSQKPSAWPSIYTLLPAPLRQRPVKGGTPAKAMGPFRRVTDPSLSSSTRASCRFIATPVTPMAETVTNLRRLPRISLFRRAILPIVI